LFLFNHTPACGLVTFQNFYPLFRAACDVPYDAETFSSGICRSFFNVSRSLCHLEGGTDDEIQVSTDHIRLYTTGYN